MLSNSSKADDTYKLFKSTSKSEKSFTKLRRSDHNLMIEEGRRKRPMLPRNERLCNTCKKLNDEIHFLIECDKYKKERFDKFKTIKPGVHLGDRNYRKILS